MMLSYIMLAAGILAEVIVIYMLVEVIRGKL
jgi:hypothetical protein